MLPALGDWDLARSGFAAQQASEPERPDRPDNLWGAVDDDRDFGAHGRFNASARRRSWQVWLTEHRSGVTAGCLAAAAGLLAHRRHNRSGCRSRV
jgi:hypothetical protein